jgi:hypothetical protein
MKRERLERLLRGTHFELGAEDAEGNINILTAGNQTRFVGELIRRLEASGVHVKLSGDSRLVV